MNTEFPPSASTHEYPHDSGSTANEKNKINGGMFYELCRRTVKRRAELRE